MAREEIGLQPRSKVILRHAQQDFDMISSEVFFSLNFSCAGKNLCYQVSSVHLHEVKCSCGHVHADVEIFDLAMVV